MELSEATQLSSVFITSLVFKVHSLPLSVRTARAAQWWQEQGSRIPLRAAFEEKRRHLARFASRRRSDRRNEREIYLTISAIVDDYGNGQCPALAGSQCGIYDQRPLTCRTVPLHYSRQPSVLHSYIDQFTATTGYKCDVVGGPVILNGSSIVASSLRDARDRAVKTAKADRGWKQHLLSLMDDPQAAGRVGLPTYESVLDNTNNGYATLVPMMVAWRVAEQRGILSSSELASICAEQAALIKAEISRARSPDYLHELLPLYEVKSKTDNSCPLTNA
jgi:Fe-S-cluster containining protein